MPPHACRDGWICEDHPEQPAGHDDCPAAAMPCPICQPGDGKPAVIWDELSASTDDDHD